MRTFLFLLLNITYLVTFAQVGINTNIPEGALDVVSDNSGIIIPRVANTNAITNPIDGMMVYDVSSTCFKGYQNNQWSACFGDTTIGGTTNNTNIAGTDFRTLTTSSDGLDRDYIVYIPSSAEGATNVPVLFFFHGTNQNGQIFYNNANQWNQKADNEGFIVVYPTAKVHCHFDQGIQRTVTKWAFGDLGENDATNAGLPLCSGETLADDMEFIDDLVQIIKNDYAVDENRLYLSGFSNGAQMAARLASQRSDVFAAAYLVAGNHSNFLPQTPMANPIPIELFIGNQDDTVFSGSAAYGGLDYSVPVTANDQFYINYPLFESKVIQTFLNISGLDNTFTYSNVSASGTTIHIFNYTSSNLGLSNTFRYNLVEGVGHTYLNDFVDPTWSFLTSHSLP